MNLKDIEGEFKELAEAIGKLVVATENQTELRISSIEIIRGLNGSVGIVCKAFPITTTVSVMNPTIYK